MLAEIPFDSALGRLLRAPLRLIPRDSVLRIRRGPLKGCRWVAGASTHGCWLGTHEKEKLHAFADVLELDSTVYDIGANAGLYTILAAVAAPLGTVFAFEPLERNLRYLRRHLELNRIQNCTVIPAAVSSAHGWGQFQPGAKPDVGHLASQGTIRVRVVSLDTLLDEGSIPPPHVIKMDIEGTELDALIGASDLLRRHRPVLFLATHSNELLRDCKSFLDGLGYSTTPLLHCGPLELIART